MNLHVLGFICCCLFMWAFLAIVPVPGIYVTLLILEYVDIVR